MKRLKIPLLTLLMLFGLFSCQKDELIQETEIQIETNQNTEPKEMIVLGAKLENPYSVENMKKAYESLKSSGTLKSATTDTFNIEANTLYIRFLPKDSADLTLLWADTTIELFDYPMDYEIAEEGFYYHDPKIPEGQITWQYTSVPINFKFPDVHYEIIEECYIPDEESVFKSTNSNDFYGQLELEAFRITGNLNEENTLKSANAIQGKDKPEGTIQVDNTSFGLEGVMKVKVRVNNFVKWEHKYTGVDGKYKMDKNFRTNIHYAVVYENETGFKIWGNWAMFSPAVHNMGWHSQSGHSTDIGTNSKAWLWSTVNNGTYYYRETLCPKFVVSKPPSDLRIWTMRMNGQWGGSAPMCRQSYISYDKIVTIITVAVFNEVAAAVYAAIRLCLPDIFILQDYTSTRSCYATLWHELSHASHFSQVGKSYWHEYVSAICTNLGYGDGSRNIDGYIGVGEMWGNYFGNYVCCRDYFGSSVNWDANEDWYDPGILMRLENRSILTPSQIYNCLSGDENSHSKLKSKLISKYGKETDIKEAFTFYGH